MIREIASITIDPQRSADFEAAVRAAKPHFERTKGFIDFALVRSIEHAGHYKLVVGWESVDAHVVDFRTSEGFQAWRALASPFFLSAPSVEHVEQII